MEHEIEGSSLPDPDLLTSWLSTVNNWADPNDPKQTQMRNGHFSCQPQSPQLLPLLYYRNILPCVEAAPQPEKRRRLYSDGKMDRASKTTSNASASSSRTTATSPISLRNGPILNPTPPLTRYRSLNPTRKVLSRLRYATPSLRVC